MRAAEGRPKKNFFRGSLGCGWGSGGGELTFLKQLYKYIGWVVVYIVSRCLCMNRIANI